MKSLKLAGLFFLILVAALAVPAQIKPRVKNVNGYLRSTIVEKLTEQQKTPILKYLEEGRAAANEAMRLLMAEKYDDFYQSTSKNFKSLYSREQFLQLIDVFQKQTGKITFYEYRNQSLEFPADTLLSADLSKANANTMYAIKLSKVEGERFFIEVETVIENGRHTVSFIATTEYDSEIPPWLVRPGAPPTTSKPDKTPGFAF